MNSYSLSYFKHKKSQKYNYDFYNCRLKHLKNAVKFAQMLFFMDGSICGLMESNLGSILYEYNNLMHSLGTLAMGQSY